MFKPGPSSNIVHCSWPSLFVNVVQYCSGPNSAQNECLGKTLACAAFGGRNWLAPPLAGANQNFKCHPFKLKLRSDMVTSNGECHGATLVNISVHFWSETLVVTFQITKVVGPLLVFGCLRTRYCTFNTILTTLGYCSLLFIDPSVVIVQV